MQLTCKYFIDPEHLQGEIKGLSIEEFSERQILQQDLLPSLLLYYVSPPYTLLSSIIFLELIWVVELFNY